jgi:hypothetical protein
MTSSRWFQRGILPVGNRYGRLLIVRFSHMNKWNQRVYLCRCDCGTEKAIHGRRLVIGNARSCGCLSKEVRTRHGKRDSTEYRIWTLMWQRCTNKKLDAYKWYGARGISVCERWRKFENFLADMGERPPGMTLDRFPNKDGHYEPGNCRWATATEQARNRSSARLTFDSALQIASEMLAGGSPTEIAKRFGCSKSLPREIASGRTWKDALAKAKENL